MRAAAQLDRTARLRAPGRSRRTCRRRRRSHPSPRPRPWWSRTPAPGVLRRVSALTSRSISLDLLGRSPPRSARSRTAAGRADVASPPASRDRRAPTQRPVQQVRAGVVAADGVAALGVDRGASPVWPAEISPSTSWRCGGAGRAGRRWCRARRRARSPWRSCRCRRPDRPTRRRTECDRGTPRRVPSSPTGNTASTRPSTVSAL